MHRGPHRTVHLGRPLLLHRQDTGSQDPYAFLAGASKSLSSINKQLQRTTRGT